MLLDSRLAAGRDAENPSTPQPLVDAMWDHLLLPGAALPLVGHLPVRGFPGAFHRQEKILRFSWLRDRLSISFRIRAIGLALIHLPIPHPPAIYSRNSRAF